MKKMMSFCTKPTEETLILVSRAESYFDLDTVEIPPKDYVKDSNFFKQLLYFKHFEEGFDVLGVLTDDEPIFLLRFKYVVRSSENASLSGFHQARPNTALKIAFRNMLGSCSRLKNSSVKCVGFKLKFSGFLERINAVIDCSNYTSVIDCLELLDLIRTKPHALQSVKFELSPLFFLTKNNGSYLHASSLARLDFEKLLDFRLGGIKKIFVATPTSFCVLDVELFFKINPLTVFVSFVRPRPDNNCTEVELCTRSLTCFTCTAATDVVNSRIYLGAHVRIVFEGLSARVVWETLGTSVQLTYLSSAQANKIAAMLQN